MNTKKWATFSLEEGMLPLKDFVEKIRESEFEIVKNNRREEYYNIPAAFDIETSSYKIDGIKRASMYIWQFGILNWVTYGRTWGEFVELLSTIKEILGLHQSRRLLVYVHNLGYEFQFMKNWINWDKVFFIDKNHPVYALNEGVEFRCSLRLSGKSLENTAKDLQKYKLEKQTGLLKHTKIRHSETALKSKELKYAEYDIRVLLAYIQEKIEQDGNISRIPLTNTGYVRNYCRKRCFRDYKRYRSLMDELRLDVDEYRQLRRAFAGGFAHASFKAVNKVLENVDSYDINSSYPATMVLEKFPMSKAKSITEIKSEDEFRWYLKNYCCLFDITIFNLKPKNVYEHIISKSKCMQIEGDVVDNGRVVLAESLTITLTEQDFFSIDAFYYYDSFIVKNLRVYEKGYLPKDLVLSILELYKKKTTLKGVDGEEINYMISKNMVNSAYGMMVTAVDRDVVNFEDGVVSVEKPDLESEIEKYNKSKRRFLFYPWGVWVTAYSRANLLSAILEFGVDYKYSDTDSVKGYSKNHKNYFIVYNNNVRRKINEVSKHYKIPIELFEPKTNKGKIKTIGVWDYEGCYSRFKTLGSKRYLVEENGKLKVTAAGTNKSSTSKFLELFLDPFKKFAIGLEISEYFAGRLILTYVDTGFRGAIVDYNGIKSNVEERSYIHMEPGTFHFDISVEYSAFLQEFVFSSEEDSF